MPKEMISYSDFEKLDLRIGKVVEANTPDWSNKLLEFKVDFGLEIGERTIFAGVKELYEPSFFLNKLFVFIVNLAEKKMGQGVSCGMMLMADSPVKPIPLELPSHIPLGIVVR